MNNEFWVNFWSSLFSNLALIAILSIAGFLAKASIVKSIKKFISEQVTSAVEQVEEEKGDGQKK
jgi:hypothetical protein